MAKNRPDTCHQVYLALRRSWWYGFAFSTGYHMLIQDWLGLEGYIAFAREHWVDIHWSVGLMLATAGLGLWVCMLNRFHWLEEEKEHGS